MQVAEDYPHGARRYDQPCRSGSARDGEMLRGGLAARWRDRLGQGESRLAISVIRARRILTLDGTSGEVMAGRVATVKARNVGPISQNS